MGGETGGLDKSTHTRIEERRCGYEHFSSSGLTVEKKLRENKAHENFCSASSFRFVRVFREIKILTKVKRALWVKAGQSVLFVPFPSPSIRLKIS